MYPLVRRVVVWPFLVAVMAVSALACRVDATVTVDVVADGSGTVAVALELDAAAVEALGGLDGRVHVDDLVAAGWKVTGPTTDLSGGGQISAVKPFTQPSHLGPVLAEVVGPTAIRDVSLVRANERSRTSDTSRMAVGPATSASTGPRWDGSANGLTAEI